MKKYSLFCGKISILMQGGVNERGVFSAGNREEMAEVLGR